MVFLDLCKFVLFFLLKMIGQPSYSIDPKTVSSVVQIPSRIVTRCAQVQGLTNVANTQSFNIQLDDNQPKYIKIKNICVLTNNAANVADPTCYQIVLPSLCDFNIFIPGTGQQIAAGGGQIIKSQLTIGGLASFEYFFSNYQFINNNQLIQVTGIGSNGNNITNQGFFVDVFMTFEFYY